MKHNRYMLASMVSAVALTSIFGAVPHTAQADGYEGFFRVYTDDHAIRKGDYFILGKNTVIWHEFESGRWNLSGTQKLAKGTGLIVTETKQGYINFEDKAAKEAKEPLPPKRKFLKVKDLVENREFWVEQNGYYAEQTGEQQAYTSGYQVQLTYGANTDVYVTRDTRAYKTYDNYNTETFKGTKSYALKKNTRLVYLGIVYVDGDYFVKTEDGYDTVYFVPAKDLDRGLSPDILSPEEVQPEEIEPIAPEIEPEIKTDLHLNVGVYFISNTPMKGVYANMSSTKGLYNEVTLPPNQPYEYVNNTMNLGETVAKIKNTVTNKYYYITQDNLYTNQSLSLYKDSASVGKETRGKKATLTRNVNAYTSVTSNGSFSGKYAMKKGDEVTVQGYVTSKTGGLTYARVTIGLDTKEFYVNQQYLTVDDIAVVLTPTTNVTIKNLKFQKQYKGYKGIVVTKGNIVRQSEIMIETHKVYKYLNEVEKGGVRFIRVQDPSTKVVLFVEKNNINVIFTQQEK